MARILCFRTETPSGKWIKTVLYNPPTQTENFAFLGTISQEDPRRFTELYGYAHSNSIWKLTYMKYTRPHYSMLYTLNGGSDGADILGIALGSDGNIYGATAYGGDLGCDRGYGCGVVFELKQPTRKGGKWHFGVLHAFTGFPDGELPYAGVTVDRKGNVYGTTAGGGVYGYGALYRLSPPGGKSKGWRESVIYSVGAYGAYPEGPLAIDRSGSIYATTYSGGVFGAGTVFRLSPPQHKGGGWNFADLYDFRVGDDGGNPEGAILLDSNGNLYSTTSQGGKGLSGTVFRLTKPMSPDKTWTETVLHWFPGGTYLDRQLTWGKWGHIYGLTYLGGETPKSRSDGGAVYELRP